MDASEAKEILRNPKFGDPNCIAALKALRESEEADGLRKALVGKKIECWCCEGTGELRCKAGCMGHECPTCNGDDELTITTSFLADLSLYQLRDLATDAHP